MRRTRIKQQKQQRTSQRGPIVKRNNSPTKVNAIIVPFCLSNHSFLGTEIGPEIPFELGQFLLYKGHFLNLLHFPIWKVHTKTLLLKYDTVLADSEIAWEATDEVSPSTRCSFLMTV